MCKEAAELGLLPVYTVDLPSVFVRGEDGLSLAGCLTGAIDWSMVSLSRRLPFLLQPSSGVSQDASESWDLNGEICTRSSAWVVAG